MIDIDTVLLILAGLVIIGLLIGLERQDKKLEKTENVLSDASFRLMGEMSKSSRLAELLQRERNRTLAQRTEAQAKVDDGAHIFAQRVVVDHDESQIYVDGVRLPWYLAIPGPEVQAGSHDQPLTTVSVPILVDGTVEVIGEKGTQLVDSVLGDVAEYARRMVRREMAAAFPWLEV